MTESKYLSQIRSELKGYGVVILLVEEDAARFHPKNLANHGQNLLYNFVPLLSWKGCHVMPVPKYLTQIGQKLRTKVLLHYLTLVC